MKRTYISPISKAYNIHMTSHILDGSYDAGNVGGDGTETPGGTGSGFDGSGSGSGSTGTEDGARNGSNIWSNEW